jgi:glycosyltransferase involved in cell wall biosynthesis
VLIPSYNEVKTIGHLVRELKNKGLDVIVVDDGSKDGTGRIAREESAVVLTHNENMGKGLALREGFKFVLNNGYDAVLTMDGDGQHSPEAIPHFLEQLARTKSQLIVGNRMVEAKGMPLIRWLTNKFMSFVISSICGQRIPDSQCGYRLIRRDVLEKIRLSTSKYEIESEILIEASHFKFIIDSIPIRTIYKGQMSQIDPIIDTLRFIRFIFKRYGLRHLKKSYGQ